MEQAEDAIPTMEQPPFESPEVEEPLGSNHIFKDGATLWQGMAMPSLIFLFPPGLTPEEFDNLKPAVAEFHNYRVNAGQCSSILAQRVHAPPQEVWSIVRRFDKPQTYKHFIKSCSVREGFSISVGALRDVSVISGLPAATSVERMAILDDERRVTGFSIIGGDHRLRSYRSVTSVHERGGWISAIVLESYAVDVPEGNTEEDTRLFADTVVKLNLQKLASAAEAMAAGD